MSGEAGFRGQPPATANTTSGHGIGVPGTVPNPKSVNGGGKSLTPTGPRTMRARPRKRASVPMVTTSDGRPPRATSSPFSRPPMAPTSRTTGMATWSGTPAAQRTPMIALARPAIDSTERSISPAMMTRVIGSAMIATSISAAERFVKFPGVRKNGERLVPRTIRPRSPTASTVSHRARPRSGEPTFRVGAAAAVIGRGAPP